MGCGKRKPAFTLIELLIVVVILGIIAAIVVPQFSIATDDARLSSMRTNLQAMRTQLQLYKLEHNDKYPTDNTTLPAQLTGKTDAAGAVGTDYGPYLLMIPENPFTGTNDIMVAKVIDASSANKSAWFYLVADARVFRANDTEAHHDDLQPEAVIDGGALLRPRAATTERRVQQNLNQPGTLAPVATVPVLLSD